MLEFSTSKVDILLNYLELMTIVLFILMVLFVRMTQPVFIIGIIILIILLYSYVLYDVMNSYWFSYILIIVILRGVLVVFTYIITLIPNERFENFYFIFLFFLIIIFISGWNEGYSYNINYLCLHLWLSYVRFINLFIVRFLLGIILIVVWLGYINEGAIRVN